MIIVIKATINISIKAKPLFYKIFTKPCYNSVRLEFCHILSPAVLSSCLCLVVATPPTF